MSISRKKLLAIIIQQLERSNSYYNPDVRLQHAEDLIAKLYTAGWCVVPRIPTDEMTILGAQSRSSLPSTTLGDHYWEARACYRAMLDASPLNKACNIN